MVAQRRPLTTGESAPLGDWPRSDVDDAVDRVRAPQRRAGTAYDLDAIDVFELVVERVPEDAGEQRAVHRPPIDHDEHLVRRDRRETARRDGPRAVVEARDVDAVGKSDGIGQRRHAGAADILSGHDRNRCRRGCHWLRAPRGQRHIDLHQLLDGQPLEVLRRRFRCGERRGQNDDDGKGGHRVSHALWGIVIDLGLSNRDAFQD